ncbi:stage VI sporulation protein D [Virgibacillus natechei]|uniref:Stage VI sporulation protein D n=1 Tax=Virgibacillus natechei TaxID=1216297 RepID=A0ABS4ICZ0_9BACI|nr:stage VI sporulation protein D [Virgibacillus natechei]MBP1968809.1 stage VI sporulation protein D [Virgibacillus natechei]UZD11608.1 stage VI sporulation protein D [Virgibacillus natechei]
MSNDQSVFSFELNESLYFEKGQEVAEMRGISLDPEISIQSFNEYISIRGVIELNGEYQKVVDSEEDNDFSDLDNFQSHRYVESVIDTEDDSARFSHRFPVEISVPSYRVTDLNDVTVSIESFDYEIPDKSQLKLYSTIEIDGINSQATEVREEEEEQEEVTEPIDEAFQFEIKEKKEIESPSAIEPEHPEHVPELSIEEQEPMESERWKSKKSQTLKEFFDTISSQEEESSSIDMSENPNPPPSVFESESSSEFYYEESTESRSEKLENVSYLSDMFRGTEEEQYTQMRLCIVQSQDTIETIAERYDITALQLMKQNQIDDNYAVVEGEMLYIPDINR